MREERKREKWRGKGACVSEDDDAFINKCRRRFLSMPCTRPIFSAKTTTTATATEASAHYAALFGFCLVASFGPTSFSAANKGSLCACVRVCVCECVCACVYL